MLRYIAGIFLIIVGVLLFIFLRALNDPEIEGDSGGISLGAYFISLIPTVIGVIVIFFKKVPKR